MQEETEIDSQMSEAHGIREGFYSNLPGPDQRPLLVCYCGFETSLGNHTWEEAGRELDEHLAAVARLLTPGS